MHRLQTMFLIKIVLGFWDIYQNVGWHNIENISLESFIPLLSVTFQEVITIFKLAICVKIKHG
jgi:hypothetical protein